MDATHAGTAAAVVVVAAVLDELDVVGATVDVVEVVAGGVVLDDEEAATDWVLLLDPPHPARVRPAIAASTAARLIATFSAILSRTPSR